jgi:hypothetical protein
VGVAESRIDPCGYCGAIHPGVGFHRRLIISREQQVKGKSQLDQERPSYQRLGRIRHID